jgi:hypothetical protein
MFILFTTYNTKYFGSAEEYTVTALRRVDGEKHGCFEDLRGNEIQRCVLHRNA